VGQIPDNVCVHCFCDPCVTGNPQAWYHQWMLLLHKLK
jgi:hypothetical protein